ncbi:uncharacterized protein LOC121792969 isoform X2 [Salvia splendens]|uniref:uncharacterized protein LOC121792969 isoform X2 n=1 Tax=Salvia splendens TaxID=180675 RepID=UPI001C276986|nr:uncharacterized protein LOC121792969 isoform X2 [Salvia splendens]
MSFRKVYETLQDLFPLIDVRVLKAVAIEHSKDVDEAAVAVIDEIIPFLASHSVCERHPEVEGDTVRLTLTVDDDVKMDANIHSQGESLVVVGDDKVHTCQIEVFEDPETERTHSAEDGTSFGSDPLSTVGMSQDVEMGVGQKTDCIQEIEEDAGGKARDISVSTSGVEAEASDVHESNLDEYNLPLSTESASSGKNISSTLGTEDKSTLNASMSNKNGIIDVLEEIIADARNNKKTLFTEMESVINLMKQVEVEEQAAEQAKTEAERGDIDLLNQVEELKRMLQHAKEANNMHAGEVYGEKAILATELRELHSRLRSLSDDRDQSLTYLAEMRQCLEVRLAAAENEIKSALLKKLEKEEVSRKSLVEQEFIMEQVVQESKILRQHAEDNAKLHEFLVDRGQLADTLQGEIAVICQDVKQLKEKFDQRLPLGKSLFSGQTSFLLASSTSSMKSFVPDQVEPLATKDDEQLNTGHETDHVKDPENEPARVDCRLLAENYGWELFDSSEAKA